MHGVESTEQSAAWFMDYSRRNNGFISASTDDKNGGNYQRFMEGKLRVDMFRSFTNKVVTPGSQSIAKGIARLVGSSNIHLSSLVASIENRQSHVRVVTTNGLVFTGRKCILSIPSTTYQELNISPPLPRALQEVANNTILGDYNKFIICYDRPWWKDEGYNGYFLSYVGPINLARDTSVDEKRNYQLTCFVNGQSGREWSKLPPRERRAQAVQQIAKVFNADADHEVFRPIEMFDQIWMHEQYSRGALATIHALGYYTKFADAYGKTVGNVHFVGTEYATRWKGYMEGALNSGDQGAQEVVLALKRDESRARL